MTLNFLTIIKNIIYKKIIETHDRLFLIMEYTTSGELFDYIVAKGRLPPDESRTFFHQVTTTEARSGSSSNSSNIDSKDSSYCSNSVVDNFILILLCTYLYICSSYIFISNIDCSMLLIYIYVYICSRL